MTKQCRECKEEKPKSVEFFSPENRTIDGFQSRCKECMRLAYRKRYRSNRERLVKLAAEYRLANKEKFDAACKKYRSSAKRKALIKKHKTENRQSYRAAAKRYRLRHPMIGIKFDRIRCERERTAKPKWLSKQQIKEIREIYRIASELSWLSDGGLCVDHIIPLKGEIVSGLHVPWNLQIIPRSENSLKGNKLIHVHA